MSDQRILRAFGAADLPAVLALEAQSHALPWGETSFLSSLIAGHWMQGVFSIGSEVEQLLAYAVFAEGIDDWELLNVTTAPAHRNQGLAAQLMAAGKAKALACGAQRILLEVRPSNTPALTLYQAHGFAQIARRKAYYASLAGASREDALIYALNLPTSDEHLSN